MPNISRRDLEALAVGFGIADFFLEGKLSAPIGRATKAALRKAAPAIARAVIKFGPTVATSAARVTPGPVAAAALGVTAIQNRERIVDAAGNVFEKVGPVAQDFGAGVLERLQDPATFERPNGPISARDLLITGITGRKRKKSKFNKAIAVGMDVVKKSTSFGKKGVINNAKKAFTTVTKTASKINKGGKVAKKGIQRKIGLAIKKVLK